MPLERVRLAAGHANRADHRTVEGGSTMETMLSASAMPQAPGCDSVAHFEKIDAACKEAG